MPYEVYSVTENTHHVTCANIHNLLYVSILSRLNSGLNATLQIRLDPLRVWI